MFPESELVRVSSILISMNLEILALVLILIVMLMLMLCEFLEGGDVDIINRNVNVLFLGMFLESELVRVSSIQITMNLEM